MSELKYFITAQTKEDNPRVVFFSVCRDWRFDHREITAQIASLKEAFLHIQYQPTDCLLVEANEGLRKELSEIFHAPSTEELRELIRKHGCHTVSTKKEQKQSNLELMLEELPENRPLYKDSGSWQVRSDDMEDILFDQEVNETFFDFIKRVFEQEKNRFDE